MPIYNNQGSLQIVKAPDPVTNDNAYKLDSFVYTILYNVKISLNSLSQKQKDGIIKKLAECYKYNYLVWQEIFISESPDPTPIGYNVKYANDSEIIIELKGKLENRINNFIYLHYLKDRIELKKELDIEYKKELFTYSNNFSPEEKIGFLLFYTHYEYWKLSQKYTIASTLDEGKMKLSKFSNYKNEYTKIKDLYSELSKSFQKQITIIFDKGNENESDIGMVDNLYWVFNCNVPDIDLKKIAKLIGDDSEVYKGYRKAAIEKYSKLLNEEFQSKIYNILKSLRIASFGLIASGDGTGTFGLLGYNNLSVRLFNYGFTAFSGIKKEKTIFFGPKIKVKSLFLFLLGSNGHPNEIEIKADGKLLKLTNNTNNNIIKLSTDILSNDKLLFSEKLSSLTSKPDKEAFNLSKIQLISGKKDTDFDELLLIYFSTYIHIHDLRLNLNLDNSFNTDKFHLTKTILSPDHIDKISWLKNQYNIEDYEFELSGHYIGKYQGLEFPKVLRNCSEINISEIKTKCKTGIKEGGDDDLRLRYSSVKIEIKKSKKAENKKLVLNFIIESFVSPAASKLKDNPPTNTLIALRTFKTVDIKINNPILSGLRSFGTAKKILGELNVNETDIKENLNGNKSTVRCMYYPKDKEEVDYFFKQITYKNFEDLLKVNK